MNIAKFMGILEGSGSENIHIGILKPNEKQHIFQFSFGGPADIVPCKMQLLCLFCFLELLCTSPLVGMFFQV